MRWRPRRLAVNGRPSQRARTATKIGGNRAERCITTGERDAPVKENRARPSVGCRGGASLPHLRLSIAICRGSLPICTSKYQSIRHNFEMRRRPPCRVKNNQDRWRVLHTSSASRPLGHPCHRRLRLLRSYPERLRHREVEEFAPPHGSKSVNLSLEHIFSS